MNHQITLLEMIADAESTQDRDISFATLKASIRGAAKKLTYRNVNVVITGDDLQELNASPFTMRSIYRELGISKLKMNDAFKDKLVTITKIVEIKKELEKTSHPKKNK